MKERHIILGVSMTGVATCKCGGKFRVGDGSKCDVAHETRLIQDREEEDERRSRHDEE